MTISEVVRCELELVVRDDPGVIRGDLELTVRDDPGGIRGDLELTVRDHELTVKSLVERFLSHELALCFVQPVP